MATNTIGGPIRHKVIIGIDYGTTYSGVSYVTTDKTCIEDINIITTWPGELSTSFKAPTRIAYVSENRNLQRNKWGFEVESRHTSYSWTKLLLDRNAAAGEFDDPSLASLNVKGLMKLPPFRDATGVCEDYLREVYLYVSGKLRRQMGSTTFDLMPMECWVTLPAIWSDQAKDATLRAAKNAGFGSRAGDEVFTIAEPEAAAIATLKMFSNVNAVNAVKPNEHILICDCGGGTVDITTYTIIAVEPQLTFAELCVGVGGKCGSTYIDRNLHGLLSKRFGAEFDNVPQFQKGPGSRFMTSFEKVKRTFGVSQDMGVREVYPLAMQVPDSEFYDGEERTVKLSYADMQAVFDPVIHKIIKLVNQQVVEARVKKGALINRIILVGGFGDSAYLNQELAKWCLSHGNIQLMCPDHPQAAVVRGAALRGLESIVPQSRQARRHYGFEWSLPFRNGKDAEEHGYIDRFSGDKYCSGRMKWAVKKGETIIRDTHRSYTLLSEVIPGQSVERKVKLFSSSQEKQAERFDNQGVEFVGQIVSHFPANIDFGAALESVFSNRLLNTIYEIEYEVQVVFGKQGDNLTFNTVVNGVVYGSTNIGFNSSF